MIFNRIKCFLVSIVDIFKYRAYIPHVYVQEFEPQVAIMSTEDSFRCSNSYERNEGEQCHVGAILIRNKCKYCGKENLSWCEKEFYDRYLEE